MRPGQSVKSNIIILGAGPAGLAAAITLGKKGIPCYLVDENHFPREKICGDGLSGKVLSALSKLDPSLRDQLGRSGFVAGSRPVRFYSAAHQMAEISFQDGNQANPTGYVCKRIDFDHFLLRKAVSYPSVNFTEGVRINQITHSGSKVIIENTDSGMTLEAQLLLIATGASNVLLNKSGFATKDISLEGIGVRAYFENITGSSNQNAIEIHFLKELLPWYLWIFPYDDGSANVGLALPMALAKKSTLSLKKLLFHLIVKYPYLHVRFSDAKIKGKIAAHRLPFYTGQSEICGDRYMLLGDAASLVDPFTGEGISNAMVSGMIAADIAAECYREDNYSRQMTVHYKEKVYQKLGEELELGLKLQKLASRPELLNLVIGRASKNEKIRKLLGDMLFRVNAMGKLKNPLFYLKLLLKI